MVLGMALTFCSSMAKGKKTKVKVFQGLISTFGEFTRKKLVGEFFAPHTEFSGVKHDILLDKVRSICVNNLLDLHIKLICAIQFAQLHDT